MARRPYFQFYPADWRDDTGLRMCSLAARGLWWEVLCIMHHCEPYGHLVSAGVAITPTELVRMVGENRKNINRWLAELEKNHVFSRNDDGIIYSRRMVRDGQQRDKWRDRQALSRGSHSDVTAAVTPMSPRSSSSSSSSLRASSNGDEEKARDAANFQKLYGLLNFDRNDISNWLEFVAMQTKHELDFDRHIWPAAQAHAAAGKFGKTLAYIRPKAIDLKTAAIIAANAPKVFEEADFGTWISRVKYFSKQDTELEWPTERWGPRWDDPGAQSLVAAAWKAVTNPPQTSRDEESDAKFRH